MNLESTIFDYTSDPNILNNVLGLEGISKEEYINSFTLDSKACDLLDLAEHWNDDKMIADVMEIFGEVIGDFFNE